MKLLRPFHRLGLALAALVIGHCSRWSALRASGKAAAIYAILASSSLVIPARGQVSIGWDEINKTGASLADLPTRQFSALQGKPTTLSGYGISDAQPLDSDLTSIAALATTTFGRSLLTQADAPTTRSTLGLVIGTNVQAFDSDLSALAATASTGLYAITATGTSATRTITAPAAGITVSNGNGVSGNPTLALANDLAALEGLASTGLAARTATDAWAQRTITGTAPITITNGNGVSGNPTVAITAATTSATGSVRLATTSETITGTATDIANTPAGNAAALSAYVDPVGNARAPRQGATSDGTNLVAKMSPFVPGTKPFGIFVNAKITSGNSTNCSAFVGYTNYTPGFVFYRDDIGGLLVMRLSGVLGGFLSSTTACPGTEGLFGYTRDSSNVGRFWFNGVQLGANVADARDYSGETDNVGWGYFNGADGKLIGTIRAVYPYNYAISAAQIAELHATGVPAAADMGGSNALLNTTAFYNSGVVPFSAFSGASSTGFTATGSGGNNRVLLGPINIEAGKNYTVSFTASGTGITSMACAFSVEDTSLDSNAVFLSSGSQSIVLTANKTGVSYFTISGTTSGTVTVAGLGLVRRGVLLALDSQQRGVGYQWADISGNRADATMPASGVKWLLPATTGAHTVRGSLTWSGTHEPKSLLGQIALPSNARVTSITTNATAASSGSGLTLGTTNSATRWVALNTYSTGLKAHTVANVFPAGTAAGDLDLVLDPDTSNYTGTITVTVDYTLTN